MKRLATKSAVTQTVDDATAATKTLTDSPGSLGKPDTESELQQAFAQSSSCTQLSGSSG